MADAPKPLLIHCEHGANRTGLASAIYVGAVRQLSETFANSSSAPISATSRSQASAATRSPKSWDEFEETIGF
jgi:protein tyrosine/serine phosphatase